MGFCDFDEEINDGSGYPGAGSSGGSDGYTGTSTPMSRKRALKVRDVSKTKYGGYVYDYSDRQTAREVLGDEYYD